MRTILNCILISAISAACATAQTATAPIAFEVASVKPSAPITPAMIQSGKIHVGMKIDQARVDIGNFSLMQLICEAYKVKTYQVVGPDWMKNLAGAQRFDVTATMPAGATKEQVPEMLQALLAERFKLKAHKEPGKETNVYALIVAKGGPKFKESAPPPAPAADDEPNKPASSGSNTATIKTTGNGATISSGTGETQKMSMSPDGKSMKMEISNTTISKLAEGLTPMVDRPIVDMTELTARYDVTLDLSTADLMNAARAAGANVPAPAPAAGGGAAGAGPADAASDPGGGSLFTAIQALGLKLEKRKMPLASIIIEGVEKMPTEN